MVTKLTSLTKSCGIRKKKAVNGQRRKEIEKSSFSTTVLNLNKTHYGKRVES